MNEKEYWEKRIRDGFVKCDLPEYMIDGVLLWVLHGIRPGDFLTAVLIDSLKESCARADENNKRRIFEWAKFIYNDVPGQCQGSQERVKAWRGLEPREEKNLEELK